jgi:serine/threonine protein phosphatase 1
MFAVWKRWKENEILTTDYIMVFGHTPTKYYQDCNPLRIWHGNNAIGIDCGSGFPDATEYGGCLACLRLDDMKVYYSDE